MWCKGNISSCISHGSLWNHRYKTCYKKRNSFRKILNFATSCKTNIISLNTFSQKILKKSRSKKLMKSNKSISWKIFLTKINFLQFQKWPKINFWTGKKFKTAVSRKKFLIYLISRVSCLAIFKFSGLLCSSTK